jgi:hypothetical protein
MWNALRSIAKRERCKINDICSLISLKKNPDTSLTAAIRVFLMLYYRAAATEEGHVKAAHGNFEHMIDRANVMEDEGMPNYKKTGNLDKGDLMEREKFLPPKARAQKPQNSRTIM